LVILSLAAAAGVYAEPVSWSRDIAPVLAFHCNRCHGDEGIAAAFDTRTYEGVRKGGNLGPAVTEGKPEHSLLIEFLEGRRGESRRMPLQAPALSEETIDQFLRWIREGAQKDPDTAPRERLRLEVSRSTVLRVRVSVPSKSYVILKIAEGALYRGASVVERAEVFVVRTTGSWPRKLAVEAEILYGQPGAKLELLR